VLLDGMCALGHMKRRHPQRRPRPEPALDLRCVPIREINGNKKRRVSVDGHWDGRCDGCQQRSLNSDRVLQSPDRLRAKCGRQNFLARGREIRPVARLLRRSLGNNAGNHRVALPEFYCLTRTQPSLQPLGIPKLANVYAGHGKSVPQYVTHCQSVLSPTTES
jgi:hypothetical protein